MDLSDPSVLYHEGYQQGSVEEKALRAAEVIAAAIASEFQPDSVLDVGSGAGALVRAFLLLGKDSRGVDGSLHIKHVAEQVWGGDAFLDIADLRKPYFAGRKFDVVTCFDVAEHIEEQYAGTLCRTLVNNTNEGGHILLGPAPEGQDGVGHVNLQHPTYWIEKMENYGAKLLPHVSERLRRSIRLRPEHNTLWWVAKNLMVFRA
jgi:cyclopropane fatty-acyl-phospholipid synthase-like methyltransferase